jgi:hypothetical protein
VNRYVAAPQTSVQVSSSVVPRGFLGTRETVRRIKGLIRNGTRDFYVRQKAIDILLERHVKSKDYLGEIKALFEWVQQNVRYTKDAFRVEMIHSARRMLELRAGDCDDMVILLGALLQSIGHPVRLVLCGPDSMRPRLLSHIYLEVFHKGLWIPLDATMSYSMGWQPRIGPRIVVRLQARSGSPSGVRFNGNIGDTGSEWLTSLVRAIEGEAVQPRDRRVSSLWGVLRQRDLLGRSRWLRDLLRRIWGRGLTARPRPRTTTRLSFELRNLGILTPAEGAPRASVVAIRAPLVMRRGRRRSSGRIPRRARSGSRARLRG